MVKAMKLQNRGKEFKRAKLESAYSLIYVKICILKYVTVTTSQCFTTKNGTFPLL